MTPHEIRKLPWPENLLRTVFGDEEYDSWKEQFPPDFEVSFKYVLQETLSERETYILYAFFRDRVKMREIGTPLGIQSERCRQIKDKAIRRMRHPSRMKYLRYGMAEVERQRKEPPQRRTVEKHSIDELKLSCRARNCLHFWDIYYVEDLVNYSASQLLRIPNMGMKSIADVESKLKAVGLALSSDEE